MRSVSIGTVDTAAQRFYKPTKRLIMRSATSGNVIVAKRNFRLQPNPNISRLVPLEAKFLRAKANWECCYCNKRFSMNERAAHLAICNFDRSGNCRSKISRRNVAAHATTSPCCFQKFPRERKDVHEAECWRCRRCLAQLPRSQQKTHSLTCKYWICARCEKQMSLTDKAHHRWSVCQA